MRSHKLVLEASGKGGRGRSKSEVNRRELEDLNRTVYCACGNSTRYFVLVLGSLYLSILMSTVIAFNTTYLAMTDIKSSPLYNSSRTEHRTNYNDQSLSMSDRRFAYTTLQKSVLLAIVFVGAVAGLFPLGASIEKFGTRKVIAVIGVFNSVLTALIPLAACRGFYVLCVIRFFQGCSTLNLFPVVGVIISHWSALTESGLFISLLSGYFQLSSIFTMPLAGWLTSVGGWPCVFYVHAVICAVLCSMWILYFRDGPQKHPFVGAKEFRKISVGKIDVIIRPPKKTPYREILSSVPLYAIWTAMMGSFYAAQLTVTFLPMYFSWVLRIRAPAVGFLCSIPLALQLCLKVFAGVCSDRIHSISEQCKIRVFNSLAQYGCAAMLIVLSMSPPQDTTAHVTLACAALSSLGLASAGCSKSAVLVARQYSPTVMGIAQVIICATLISGSFVVPCLTTENSAEQWRRVFLVYAIVLFASNTIFITFCSAEPAKWTLSDDSV